MAKAKHESFQCNESEAVQIYETFIFDIVLSSHLSLELISIILTFNLTENLHRCLLKDLFLFDLITTVLILFHLSAD